jgi:hypothetical protein
MIWRIGNVAGQLAGMMFLAIVIGSSPSLSQTSTATVISDPAAFSMELIEDLEKKGSEQAAEKIGLALANSGAKSTLAPAMSGIEKKKAAVAKIVSDKSYGDVIRVVTIYTYGLLPSNPFVYFQMTYKMSDRGWIMTGFNFKTEAQIAFPAEMQPNVK